MKKILCINYSQSGQLDEILDNFVSPIEGIQLDRVKVEPKTPFPFPWNPDNFYGIMPETVMEDPIELAPIAFKEEAYDLIILGYQPWFLSPSIPTTSLLKHEEFKKRIANTPVVTVIGARNMWLNSQTSVVKHIEDAGGYMAGNIVHTDRAPNLLSAVSIAHWMMTAKKTRKWGIFPIPGVSQEDIEGSGKFGRMLNPYIESGTYDGFQKEAVESDGLRISTSILFIEGRAKKIFYLWANLIKKKEAKGKKRKFWVRFFRTYLNFALFGIAPIVLTIYTVLFRPLTQKSIARKKKHFSYLGMKHGE